MSEFNNTLRAEPKKYSPSISPLDIAVPCSAQDIFDIGACATAIAKGFNEPYGSALDAAVKLKELELGRSLEPLRDLI